MGSNEQGTPHSCTSTACPCACVDALRQSRGAGADAADHRARPCCCHRAGCAVGLWPLHWSTHPGPGVCGAQGEMGWEEEGAPQQLAAAPPTHCRSTQQQLQHRAQALHHSHWQCHHHAGSCFADSRVLLTFCVCMHVCRYAYVHPPPPSPPHVCVICTPTCTHT